MNKIEQQIERFKKIDLTLIFKESVLETKDLLLNHIKTQHLFGIASDSGELGTYKDFLVTKNLQYRDFKATYVANYHARYGKYNLYLTGAFHDGMFIDFDLYGNIDVDSIDEKTEYLENLVEKNRSGNGGQLIFGLTKENKIEYSKQIYPIIMRKIRKQLGY